MLKNVLLISALLLYLTPVSHIAQAQGDESILELRSHFKTKLVRKSQDESKIEIPPPELFSIVQFPTSLGKMSAYLSNRDDSKQKQAAIIWITGGFPAGGIGASAWENVSPSNDQSAKIYRQMGMVMMYPFLRGSVGNPGQQEGFLGEVDDIVSALKYLQKLDYIDPKRIYLGGHSTGGTLVLLAAAINHEFKAVFAFGPVADPRVYGDDTVMHDSSNELEFKVRAPINYLPFIKTPTFVIEGSGGNIDSLKEMQRVNKNTNITFLPVNGSNHFETLAPMNALIAQKIVEANAAPISITESQVQSAFDDFQTSMLQASDLQTLANLRRSGIQFDKPKQAHFYFLSGNEKVLPDVAKELTSQGFHARPISQEKNTKQQIFYVLTADKQVDLMNLQLVFSISAKATEIGKKYQIHYDGWDLN